MLAKAERERLGPGGGELAEVLVVGLDALLAAHVEAVALVDQEIDRQADGDVGAQRGIEREESELGRLAEPHVGLHHAVDDRLAVLVLTDLEERRVVGGLDEVALGVDVEQARRLVADLPAEQEVGVEGRPARLQLRPVGLAHLAHGLAHQTRGAIKGRHREEALRARLRLPHQLLVEQAHHRLGDGQVAGRAQHDHAFAGSRQ